MTQPPHDPWNAMTYRDGAGGSLTYYYSDELARVPARAVTRVDDNKADPNVETRTYGLFSTCGPGLRSAFVRSGRRELFFTTRWKGRRVLAGYYIVKWYAPTVSAAVQDFALAASTARFDAAPLSLAEVDERLGTGLDIRFRGSLRVSPSDASRLVSLLDGRPDGTEHYLDEIDRLERLNLRFGGYRYIGRRQIDPYSWGMAGSVLAASGEAEPLSPGATNASPSDWWRCATCGTGSFNKARLRACPNCGAPGTLQPLAAAPDS